MLWLRVLLYALLIWFLYNLVFHFIIPVYKTTRQVKKKFREMHDQDAGSGEPTAGFSSQLLQRTKNHQKRPGRIILILKKSNKEKTCYRILAIILFLTFALPDYLALMIYLIMNQDP